MRRIARQLLSRRWASVLLLASLLALSIADGLFPSLSTSVLRFLGTEESFAFQRMEESSRDREAPAGGQELAAKFRRRSDPSAWERSRDKDSDHGLIRDLLHLKPFNPGFASRLDLCSEFTKPDSLVIRLMGTPKNHRSPPA